MANDTLVSTLEPEAQVEEKKIDYVLNVENLHKAYGKHKVITGLNLQVKKGEVFGFIGKNGIGKSTTIDCIVGLKEPDKGKIEVQGESYKKDPIACKAEIGYVPSEPIAYLMMSGVEYLQFIASSYGLTQQAFDSNFEFLRSKFVMSDADLNKHISEYSHGMKQKICLMASLIHNPSIWIMDEPMVGLDPMVATVLVKMIRDFADNGKTVLITSHDIELVAKLADRVGIVNNGHVERLIDFKEEPLKRLELQRIFFRIYGEDL